MIVFVRHGETAANRSGLLQGRVDVPLTERGRSQADRVAAVVAPEAPTRVLSSPLTRARDTAAVVAGVVGVDVEVDDRLVELDYGEWDQRPYAQVTPQEWERWRSDPNWAPPGGESLRAVQRRVASFCEAADPGDGTVVAVSHVSPIKAAAAWALGLDESATWRTFLGLASITRVGVRADGQPFLVSFNETAHLLTS